MKKILFAFAGILSALTVVAQHSVEKSITGIQAGYFGAHLYNESRMSDKWAFRSQIGLNGGLAKEDLSNKIAYTILPAIVLEPRHYFNLTKRAVNGKSTENNAGDYFGMSLHYRPDWFKLTNSLEQEDIAKSNGVFLLPTMGIRRNLGKNFHFEGQYGIGYGMNLGNKYKNSGKVVMNLGLKVGVNFK